MSASGSSTLASVRLGLAVVSAELPWLAALVRRVVPMVDERIETAGVFATGRLLVNPGWFGSLTAAEATFVVAHEVLHLALDSHTRAMRSSRMLFNVAHDYVINDMLMDLQVGEAPDGALVEYGARDRSAEAIVLELQERRALGGHVDIHPWRSDTRRRGYGRSTLRAERGKGAHRSEGPMQDALRRAGLLPDRGHKSASPAAPTAVDVQESDPLDLDQYGDLLPAELERRWFPGCVSSQGADTKSVRADANQALNLRAVQERYEILAGAPGSERGGHSEVVESLRSAYRPPWEAGLQRWMDAVAPGARTFARPSRRGHRTDVVLPGRRREGWTLHVVVDTSGSMRWHLPQAFGAIADFCEGANVNQVHIVQCDTDVQHDEWVEVGNLSAYEVHGFGGTDMGPALDRLGEDPEVDAVILLTDGHLNPPRIGPAYRVLWVLTPGGSRRFSPSFGTVLEMQKPRA